MIILPSTLLRNNYNDISDKAKTTGEPIYITRNGEGDLVVMDIEAFEKREKLLKVREDLIRIQEERILGVKGYSIEEARESITKLLKDLK